jgi:Asp-tRNA(Asn)/Glu-tRNA(Gln) amidotransferase A subunit family amidase
MKIYISGKITGLDENEAFKNFNEAELYLRSQGHEVVNPMTLPHQHDRTWKSYMKEDVKAMMDCDAVYLLSNFRNSKGAMIERNIAKQLEMEIIEQKDTHICDNIVLQEMAKPCIVVEPLTVGSYGK